MLDNWNGFWGVYDTSPKYTYFFGASSLKQTNPFANIEFGAPVGSSWPSSGNTISLDTKTVQVKMEIISPNPDSDALSKLKTMEDENSNINCGTYE